MSFALTKLLRQKQLVDDELQVQKLKAASDAKLGASFASAVPQVLQIGLSSWEKGADKYKADATNTALANRLDLDRFGTETDNVFPDTNPLVNIPGVSDTKSSSIAPEIVQAPDDEPEMKMVPYANEQMVEDEDLSLYTLLSPIRDKTTAPSLTREGDTKQQYPWLSGIPHAGELALATDSRDIKPKDRLLVDELKESSEPVNPDESYELNEPFKPKKTITLKKDNKYFDAEGKPAKEVIYDYKESKIKPRIMSSREINDGEILLNADDQIGVLKIGK